jgi:hypothetical protein
LKNLFCYNFASYKNCGLKNTQQLITSIIPFANSYYWAALLKAKTVLLDPNEHYEKMSFRNRYYIATAHGEQCLSIPLKSGRNQRTAMKEVQISYAENWQQQHWRTIYSAYNRSPYFEFYKDELEQLFSKKHERLLDFNLASLEWLQQKLQLELTIEFTQHYQKDIALAADLRRMKPQIQPDISFPHYYQVFEERNGFLPNLSLLDLLFNEGRLAGKYLRAIADKM